MQKALDTLFWLPCYSENPMPLIADLKLTGPSSVLILGTLEQATAMQLWK